MKHLLVKQVKTEDEFKAYFDLRWKLLRKPWHQAKGTEQDDIEDQCYHLIAVIPEHNIIGVARLQFNKNNEAQIRYMAVDSAYQHHGVGRALIEKLEAHALAQNSDKIVLDARESATGFYTKLGYNMAGKSYLLFDEIQHFRMAKKLA